MFFINDRLFIENWLRFEENSIFLLHNTIIEFTHSIGWFEGGVKQTTPALRSTPPWKGGEYTLLRYAAALSLHSSLQLAPLP